MTTTSKAAAVQAAPQDGAMPAQDFITYKNQLTTSVLNRIGQLAKGGITVPAGYKADNQIYLAFLKLSSMTTRSGQPLLSSVTPQSVANAMLTMCIQGLSLEKNQVAFIQYGNEVQYQVQYQGRIALAKRYGAGEPQAQVIYEGDVFEYEINPHTGKKVVLKHEQKLQNIDKAKIVGAWCLVPYADGKQDPKVEVMTMAEIRQSWMQGATKGESPAHRNFPAEMCKKTVISKACKLFISASDDTGVYDQTDAAEYQEAEVVDHQAANSLPASFTELPATAPATNPESAPAGVDPATGEIRDEPEPVRVPAQQKPVQTPSATDNAPAAKDISDDFFKA